MKPFLLFFCGLFLSSAPAQIHTEAVEYMHDGTVLEGYLAYDKGIEGDRPVVIVVHEWTGLNEYAKSRARQLAEMGYLAFAADIYGKGVRPANREEAAEQAGIYRSNIPLMRGRVNAALEQARSFELADADQVAAIGYCFGGGVVLELARSGAKLDGVVSFHGNLNTPDTTDAQNIKAKVLVLHGAADPYVPDVQVQTFMDEMRSANVDWQLIMYSGAVHAFTNPASGDDPSTGAAYDPLADKRSWEHMKLFFDELFWGTKF